MNDHGLTPTATDRAGRRLLTIQQLAARHGWSDRQVRHMIKKQGLPAYRVNGIRIDEAEYLEWVSSRRIA